MNATVGAERPGFGCVVPGAKEARQAAAPLGELRKAERWLRGTADAIRGDRFSPSEGHAKLICCSLKLQGKVSLEHVALKGDPRAPSAASTSASRSAARTAPPSAS